MGGSGFWGVRLDVNVIVKIKKKNWVSGVRSGWM